MAECDSKVLMVKIGGSILKSGFPDEFKRDLKTALQRNSVVLVHGGAALVTEEADRMGKPHRFIVSPGGMKSRYTDKEAMEVYLMVMAGKLNKKLTAELQAAGIKAVGICGADGGLLKAVRKKQLIVLDERGRKIAIDGGYTGKIEKVDTTVLRSLLQAGCMPVVAPIAIDDEHLLLNVDSDRAAAYLAGALKADMLILCTDVDGVILKGNVVSRMTIDESEDELSQIGHGMKKKVYAAVEALKLGVKEVVVTSGLRPAPITSALKHMGGTVIVHE